MAKNTIFLSCALAASLLSQDRSTFGSNVDVVVVPFTVVTAKGVPVGDLTRDEVHVYDNGVRRTIQNFWTDIDQPLTLGLIIDASASQKEHDHYKTALELLQRLLGLEIAFL